MRHIEEYKWLEDDRLQNKGKAPLVNRSWPRIFPLRLRRDLRVQKPEMQLGEVNVAFKEPVHKIVDRIKNEPFFRWPNKMGGDLMQRRCVEAESITHKYCNSSTKPKFYKNTRLIGKIIEKTSLANFYSKTHIT